MQWYWKFAVIIAVTTVITVTLSVWETRRVSLKHQTNNITDEQYLEVLIQNEYLYEFIYKIRKEL